MLNKQTTKNKAKHLKFISKLKWTKKLHVTIKNLAHFYSPQVVFKLKAYFLRSKRWTSNHFEKNKERKKLFYSYFGKNKKDNRISKKFQEGFLTIHRIQKDKRTDIIICHARFCVTLIGRVYEDKRLKKILDMRSHVQEGK